jgi:hypothetical protein
VARRALRYSPVVGVWAGVKAVPAVSSGGRDLTWDPREGSHRAKQRAGQRLPDARASLRALAPGQAGCRAHRLSSRTPVIDFDDLVAMHATDHAIQPITIINQIFGKSSLSILSSVPSSLD